MCSDTDNHSFQINNSFVFQRKLFVSEKYNYSFTTFISGHILQGKLFVRLQLCCSTHMEFAYYSATTPVGRRDVCCHCGGVGADKDPEMLRRYRIVLPVCEECKHIGIPKRNPIKWSFSLPAEIPKCSHSCTILHLITNTVLRIRPLLLKRCTCVGLTLLELSPDELSFASGRSSDTFVPSSMTIEW